MRFDKVAVIGFGEAGPIFAKAFLDAGAARVSAYDILIDDPATAAAQRAKTEALGIESAESSGQAVTVIDRSSIVRCLLVVLSC